uniref:Uncharacterized protein n=1 Tax=Nelumbo nucifera TaxID=4432 RepID=A0A822Y2K1_NELNU|nr:TPA_asm: hypothetical protein HUJ06_026749 [Nelumbo nucifera]
MNWRGMLRKSQNTRNEGVLAFQARSII